MIVLVPLGGLSIPNVPGGAFYDPQADAAFRDALRAGLRPDIPLREIIHVALKARPQALSFEGANPRHEHEWVVFREVKLPDDKIIIPGVLDSTTNFIEHPELVAQRLVRYAEVVGRERVIAGTDCGFATFARSVSQVEPEIAWAKFRAMAEGARLASAQLWR